MTAGLAASSRIDVSLSALPTALLIPPVNLVYAALGGMLLARWWPRFGRGLIGLSVAGLLVLSLPVVALSLMASLQAGIPREDTAAATGGLPAAIVVLSADSSNAGPGGVLDPGGVGMMSLERLHAGAVLARRTGLPLLLSGGEVKEGGASLAGRMAVVLREDFGLPAAWLEERSRDTWENAAFSAEILRELGIRRIYLVTNGWHMKRALIAFRHFGVDAVPMASRFEGGVDFDGAEFVPRASAWLRSYYAIHEWIGCLWYLVRR